jgi:hypothetical protein
MVYYTYSICIVYVQHTHIMTEAEFWNKNRQQLVLTINAFRNKKALRNVLEN